MSTTAFSLLDPRLQKEIYRMGWTHLRPIQEQAIRLILRGQNHLLICAQTAGGKTEAAFLPVLSQVAALPKPSVQALYISPLKALINDQSNRLEQLSEGLKVPVHRWHGDVSNAQKRRFRQTPSGILMITPESLESNFINYGSQMAGIYEHLEFVVVDELHSFLEDVRGIHLKSLLSRLLTAIGRKPRFIGLSATLSDTLAAQRFLSPDNPEQVDCIADPAPRREIQLAIKTYLRRPRSRTETTLEPRLAPGTALELVQSLDAEAFAGETPLNQETAPQLAPVPVEEQARKEEELDEIAEDIFRHCKDSTNLVFINDKATIETLAVGLRERVQAAKLPVDPFCVHHGSLSKELREEAENKLKTAGNATAICSGTLELGIDIGQATSVAQVDPPWSVSSLVQRLGRSGRRAGEPSILRMYVRERSPYYGSTLTDLLYPKLLRSVAIIELLLSKWLEPVDSGRMHLSTLVHQVLSCLKQTGGMMPTKLRRILLTTGPFRSVTEEQFLQLLEELDKQLVLERTREGILILAPLGEEITSQRDFYAAFKSREEFQVRHGQTEIGMLQIDAIPAPGECVILSGRLWEVKSIHSPSATIFVSPAQTGKAPIYKSAGGNIHTRVVQEMRSVLLSDVEPRYLLDKSLLRAAKHTARLTGLHQTDVIVRAQSIEWFPWVGTRCLQTLALFAKADGIRRETSELSIVYRISLGDFQKHLEGIADGRQCLVELAPLVPVRFVEKFDYLVPADLMNEAIVRNRLEIKAARQKAEETLSRL